MTASLATIIVDSQNVEASIAPLLKNLSNVSQNPTPGNYTGLGNASLSSISALSGFVGDLISYTRANSVGGNVALTLSGLGGVFAGASQLYADLEEADQSWKNGQPASVKLSLAIAGDVAEIAAGGAVLVGGGSELALASAAVIGLTGTVASGVSAFLDAPASASGVVPGVASIPAQVTFQNGYTGAWSSSSDGTSTFQISNAGVVVNSVTITTPSGALPAISSQGGTITSDYNVPEKIDGNGYVYENNTELLPRGFNLLTSNLVNASTQTGGLASGTSTSPTGQTTSFSSSEPSKGVTQTSGTANLGGASQVTGAVNTNSDSQQEAEAAGGLSLNITNPSLLSASGQTYNTSSYGTSIFDLGSRNTWNVSANNAASIEASGDSIYTTQGVSLQVGGSSNSIYAGVNESIFLSGGTANNVSSSGDAAGGHDVTGQSTGIALDQNEGATVTGNGNQIYLRAGDSVQAFGGGNIIDAYANNSVFLSGTGSTADTVYVSGDGGSGTDVTNQSTGIGFDSNATANVIGSNDQVYLRNGDTSTITGGGNVIDSYSGDNVYAASTGTSYDTIYATGDAGIHIEASDYANINGNSNTDYLANGDHSAVNGSSSTLQTGNSDIVSITGNSDKINGGKSDTFTVSGTSDPVYADNSTINYSGSNSGDTVYGNGDSGSDWGAGSGSDNGGGDGGEDPGGGGGGYYYGYALTSTAATAKGGNIGAIASYDVAHGKTQAAIGAETARLEATQAAAQTVASGLTAAVFEGTKFSPHTITWSLGAETGPSGAPINSTVGAQYEAQLQQAFATWAKASGLNFDEVSSAAGADIVVGFSDFDTVNSGILGYTHVSATGGVAQGAAIELEDPSQLALVTDSSGQSAYSGTQTEFEQLALHEIGHALGLADSADPTSIMAATLGGQNQALDVTDTSAIQALYPLSSGSATSSTSTATTTSSSAIIVPAAIAAPPANYWSALTTQSAQLIQAAAGLTSASSSAIFTAPSSTSTSVPVLLAATSH